jgi:enoyl-CoA hydratase
MENIVQLDRKGSRLDVVLDRPPVNAVSIELAATLRDTFLEAGSDASVGVVVLRANGKGFCAGLDLREATTSESDLSGLRRETMKELSNSIYNCRAPVICAIHGFAIGAGLAMAAGADIRVAAERTLIGMPEVKYGVSVGGGAAHLRWLGLTAGRLREMMLTGDLLSVRDPRAFGAVDYVVPEPMLESRTREIVDRMLHCPIVSLWAVKEAMNIAEGYNDRSQAYEATYALSDQLHEGVNVREKVREFFQFE